MRDRTVIRRTIVWLLGSSLGAGVLALPDAGAPLFQLSETHGPSSVDMVGIVIIVVSWLPVVALIWSRRGQLRGARGYVSGLLALSGVVLLVVTIASDLGVSWLLAVIMLVAAQILVLHRLYVAGR